MIVIFLLNDIEFSHVTIIIHSFIHPFIHPSFVVCSSYFYVFTELCDIYLSLGYGPSEWSIVAPDADGCNQSPVIIYPEQVDFDRYLRDHPLQVRYDGPSVRSMHNTGNSVQIDVDGNTSSQLIIHLLVE